MTIGFLAFLIQTSKINSKANSLTYLTDLRGFGRSRNEDTNNNLRTSWFLTATMFSMAGIPPLAGFFGKYLLLLHTYDRGL
jgi:NADH:ubiquinone oxidoreductase subunit 2 (subunit N)